MNTFFLKLYPGEQIKYFFVVVVINGTAVPNIFSLHNISGVGSSFCLVLADMELAVFIIRNIVRKMI